MGSLIAENSVLILRIIVAVLIGATAIGLTTFVLGKRSAKKATKQTNLVKKNTSKNPTKEIQVEKENQSNKVLQTQENNADPVLAQINQEVKQAGLQEFQYGNFTANCIKDEWISFVQRMVNEGKLEKSKNAQVLTNFVINNKNNEIQCRMKGDALEVAQILPQANLDAGDTIKVYDGKEEKVFNLDGTVAQTAQPKEAQQEDEQLKEEAENEIC